MDFFRLGVLHMQHPLRHRSDVIRHMLLEINFHKLISKLQNLFHKSTDFLKFDTSKAGFHRRMTYDV